MLTIVLRATPWARTGAWPRARAIRRRDWERPLHDAIHLAPAAPTATTSANRRVMRRMIETTPPETTMKTKDPNKETTDNKDPLTRPTYS
jgi:hypothetical protein